VASIPSATYGRMTLTAALADGGGAQPVPTACLSPRNWEDVYNFDSQPVCCGFDAKVTCLGPTGGRLIPPVDGGVPGSWHIELGCDGVRGVLYCYSDAGSATNSFGWIEGH
jgi:hypothetical protein